MADDLAGRTMFITGGSRGVGLAIAVRAARDGANVALLAKTAEPHPKLPGTVYTAAEQIETAGGAALPIVGDVRDADTVDLMLDINARGTFLAIRACIPHLERAENPHILTLSPPIDLDPRWLGAHAAYTLSKYGMTMLTLGAAEELREAGIAANCLWPRSMIATAAVQNLLGGDEAMARARTPEIYADSAYEILIKPARDCTGLALIDDEVLAAAGVTDLKRYRAAPGDEDLLPDVFVDPEPLQRA